MCCSLTSVIHLNSSLTLEKTESIKEESISLATVVNRAELKTIISLDIPILRLLILKQIISLINLFYIFFFCKKSHLPQMKGLLSKYKVKIGYFLDFILFCQKK